MDKPSHASRIEIAKAIRQLKAVATKDQHARIAEILNEGQSAPTDTAVEGLSQEDEFCMLCLLMGTATHIAPLDQRFSIATGSVAPDLLARFQPPFSDYAGFAIPASSHSGFRCFVEVKSTVKKEFKIGGKALQRLRAFADAFGLPLVFAVRFLVLTGAALWAIVEDTERTRASVTITFNSVVTGLRPMIWLERAYFLVPGTYSEARFDSATTEEGVRDPARGVLIGMRIVTPKMTYVVPGESLVETIAFLEAYAPTEIGFETRGTETRVKYEYGNKMAMVADLIFVLNRLARDDDGNIAHDPARALRQMAEGQEPLLLGRPVVQAVGERLCRARVVLPMGLGDVARNYDYWLRTGGTAPPGYAGPEAGKPGGQPAPPP